MPAIAGIALLAGSGLTQAGNLDSIGDLSQEQFRTLVENLGAATHYKAIAPAEPLGVIGFDVGAEISSTQIDSSILDKASQGDFELGRLAIPRVHAHKGLPFNLDVGASAAVVPTTDIRLLGAEVRYALVEGNVAIPAVAVRATYSKLTGLDDFDLTNAGLELTVSKGFAMLTPYGGVGRIRSRGTAVGGLGLDEETVDQNKVFVGVNVNLGINLTFEVDRTGKYSTYSAKAGLRF